MTYAHIDIVSPLSGKGLDRDYLARATIKDEFNYISIGAILFNLDGSVNKTDDMVITATDATQDRTENGTGSYWGDPHSVGADYPPCYYYPFDYAFKTVGNHTITFTSGLITNSLTINVPAMDTRP